MTEIKTEDMGIRELRANLSDRLGKAVKGEITYVTSHGVRIAAIVSVIDAEAIEAGKRAAPSKQD